MTRLPRSLELLPDPTTSPRTWTNKSVNSPLKWSNKRKERRWLILKYQSSRKTAHKKRQVRHRAFKVMLLSNDTLALCQLQSNLWFKSETTMIAIISEPQVSVRGCTRNWNSRQMASRACKVKSWPQPLPILAVSSAYLSTQARSIRC